MAPLAAATTMSTSGDGKPSSFSSSSSFTIAPALQSTLYDAPVSAYLSANPTVTNPMGSAVVFYHHHHHHHHHPRHPLSPPPPPTIPVTGINNDDDDEKKNNKNKNNEVPRLLLLQRAPTDTLPLKWELPGGSVDVSGADADASMIHGAVRELREETGLEAVRVVRELGVQREFYGGQVVGPGAVRTRTSTWRMVIFEVEVGGFSLVGGDPEDDGHGYGVRGLPLVRLAPGEHARYLWCTEDEVRAGRCGDVELVLPDPESRVVMLRAFELHRSGGQGA